MESVTRAVSEYVRNKWYLLWPGEIDFLKELTIGLPAYPVIVNIGAGKGTSGLAFLEARDDVRLYTVDINQSNVAGDGLAAERKAFKVAGLPTGNQFHHQIHDDSYRAGQHWPHSAIIDMVFIDGDHSYKAVKDDIDAWYGHIKTGGIIAFHDYKNWEVTRYPTLYGPTRARHVVEGVSRAVDERIVEIKKLEVVDRKDTIIAFRV